MADRRQIPASYWERMARQIPLVGEEGQRNIAQTPVVVIGAGGNGGWVILFCVNAGFIDITVVDRDKLLEASNLNRWPPFGGVKDLDQPKAPVIKRVVEERFPDVKLEAVVADVRSPGIWERVRGRKWAFECVDNDESRVFVNEQCVEDGINLVSVATGFRFRDSKLSSAGSRAVRAMPGDACLACSALGDLPSDNATVSLVLPNVIAAALGVNFVLREITGYAGDEQDGVNLAMFDLLHQTLTMERMLPTPGCRTCEKLNSAK